MGSAEPARPVARRVVHQRGSILVVSPLTCRSASAGAARQPPSGPSPPPSLGSAGTAGCLDRRGVNAAESVVPDRFVVAPPVAAPLPLLPVPLSPVPALSPVVPVSVVTFLGTAGALFFTAPVGAFA